METLNANQSRYVFSVLTEVRKHLDSVESIVERLPPATGDYLADLRQSDENDLRACLKAMREAIAALIEEFELPVTPVRATARWGVFTHLGLAEVELEELTSSKLSAYGDLDKNVFGLLASRVLGLQTILAPLLKSYEKWD